MPRKGEASLAQSYFCYAALFTPKDGNLSHVWKYKSLDVFEKVLLTWIPSL